MEIAGRRESERETREKRIIDVAERIFREKGINETSMDEVARMSDFTKRSLYQYFSGKEDLLFAVAIRQLSKTDFIPPNETENEAVNALDWLQQSCLRFFDICQANPHGTEIVNRAFMAIDTVPTGKWKVKFQNRTMEYYKTIVTVMKLGISQGTLRFDLEPDKAAFTFIFFLTHFIRYIPHDPDQMNPYRPMPTEVLYSYSLNLLLDSIRP